MYDSLVANQQHFR